MIWRLVGIVLFVMVLAVVVSIIRRLLLVAEQHTTMAGRIHRASIEQDAVDDGVGDSTRGTGDST